MSNISINTAVSIRNSFEFKLTNSKTGVVKEYKSYNTVLDSFLNWIRIGGTNFIAAMELGNGTGTTSSSNTSLFNSIGNKGVLRELGEINRSGNIATASAKYTIELNENEANGNITEVGLCLNTIWSPTFTPGSGGTLVTHSLITDGSGNPITIVKNDSELLTIVATVNAVITFDETNIEFPQNFRPANGDKLGWLNSTEQWIMTRAVGFNNSNISGSNTPLSISQVSKFIGTNTNTIRIDSATINRDSTSIRLSNSILSSQFNLPSGTPRLIKSLVYETFGNINFPNSAIFPARQIELTLGNGNGFYTDFNSQFPEVMATSEEIYVDGILQPSSNYEFSGKNYNLEQAWESRDTKYVDFEGISGITFGVAIGHVWAMFSGFTRGVAYGYNIESGAILPYDFITSQTINTFKNNMGVTNNCNLSLEYSVDDKETWISAATLTNMIQEVTFSPISARYWRIVFLNPGSLPAGMPEQGGYAMFGNVRPTVKFNVGSIPIDGAVITVKAYTEYPYKTANTRFDLACDFIINQS